MTPAQCVAARALLGWTQADLGDKAGFAKSVISAIENRDRRHYSVQSIRTVRETFYRAGVTFIKDKGVMTR